MIWQEARYDKTIKTTKDFKETQISSKEWKWEDGCCHWSNRRAKTKEQENENSRKRNNGEYGNNMLKIV